MGSILSGTVIEQQLYDQTLTLVKFLGNYDRNWGSPHEQTTLRRSRGLQLPSRPFSWWYPQSCCLPAAQGEDGDVGAAIPNLHSTALISGKCCSAQLEHWFEVITLLVASAAANPSSACFSPLTTHRVRKESGLSGSEADIYWCVDEAYPCALEILGKYRKRSWGQEPPTSGKERTRRKGQVRTLHS